MRKIAFFDTSLRDGEQTPGINLNGKEKLELARALAAAGIDVIEAGFPAASKGDFEAVMQIAKEIKGSSVAGLCRAVEADIHTAWEALRFAEKPRIHVFIATSPLHMEFKLRKQPDQVLASAVKAVKLAKSYCQQVEFSCEDATRSEIPFLIEICKAVAEAGATVINLPDTVGYTVPQDYAKMIAAVRAELPPEVQISAHCHDDLGMGVANTLAAIEAGADQVETTVCGIGERAGNAAFEEVVMALTTRADHYQVEHNINTRRIYNLSRLVSKYTGIDIPAGKAVIGDNAFLHQSGIHQHGVMANRLTYEIMSPESIGRPSSDNMVLGKLSGSHAFATKLEEWGFHLSPEDLAFAFARFKELADVKKDVTMRDISAIIGGRLREVPNTISLENYQIMSCNTISTTATVCLRRGDEVFRRAAIANGPVDAAFEAITDMLEMPLNLESYGIKAVTEGRDALGEVTVRVRYHDSIYMGKGVSNDIIEASILAYINAINRLFAEELTAE
ncbi:MAG: 2-isopropylmalate synthase [Firmicutes bacterium]|nr:2-isopropylmalate synthase [Bacillota bacterium]